MKIAGLDIGSTGCKLTIFDSDGSCLGKAYRDYPVKRTKTAHEVEAQDIIDSVFEVMEEMGRRHPDIAGIGVTSFGETFVLTDKAGCPLHTAMLYTDPRGADECRALEEELGSAEIAAVTGLKPHGMYSLPKIMWIKGHWPEVYRRAEHILLMEDFVVLLLTGTAQIDYSLATRLWPLTSTPLPGTGKYSPSREWMRGCSQGRSHRGPRPGPCCRRRLKGRAFPPGYRWSASARTRWQEPSERECSTPERLWNVRVRWSA